MLNSTTPRFVCITFNHTRSYLLRNNQLPDLGLTDKPMASRTTLFLSHATIDDAFVRGLQQALGDLEQPVWIDSRELIGGEKLWTRIREAIEQANAYAVVVSPAAHQSSWVGKELRHALKIQAQRGVEHYPVFVLALDGTKLGVLEEFFDEERIYIPVSSQPGGLEEALPEIRKALRLTLPTDIPSIAPTPSKPLEDLVLELSAPSFEEKDGKRRPQARARLIYQPADGRKPEVRTPSSWTFVAPLGPIEANELRWYLEQYAIWPSTVFKPRAQRVEQQLREWGKLLFDAALPIGRVGNVLQAWTHVDGDAQRRFSVYLEGETDADAPQEQRLLAREAATALLALPWELLHDGDRFLFQGAKPVRVRRRLPNTRELDITPAGLPIRVLLVTARPEDEACGYIDHRISAKPLVQAIANLGGMVELSLLDPPTFPNLLTELARARQTGTPYHVVHFDGHGVYSRREGLGGLCFEDPQDQDKLDNRRHQTVFTDKLGPALLDHRIPLVFLEACQTAQAEDGTGSVASELLQAGVASVIAMTHSVLVATAWRFVAAFYGKLAAGSRVGEAMLAAQQRLHDDDFRAHIFGAGELRLQDWFVPVLFQEKDDRQMFTSLPSGQAKAITAERQQNRLGELPKPPATGFIGRSRELLSLQRLLSRQRWALVCGNGGEGKTALAVEFARWRVESQQINRAAFVSVEIDSNPAAVLNALARQLVGKQHTLATQEELEPTILEIERELTERQTLIVLDNLESLMSYPLPVGEGRVRADDGVHILANAVIPAGMPESSHTDVKLPAGSQSELAPVPSPSGGNAVELANEVGRNKPAQAGVSGKLADEIPETVASRPYSGLRQILNSTALPSAGGSEDLLATPTDADEPSALQGANNLLADETLAELAEILKLCVRLNRIGDTLIIFTSRESLPEPYDHPRNRIDLYRLAREDAVELVKKTLQDTYAIADERLEAIENLVDTVQCHARTLALLGEPLQRLGIAKTRTQLAELMADMHRRFPNNREQSLYASVELSLRRLSPKHREQVKVLGVFHGVVNLDVLRLMMDWTPKAVVELGKALSDTGLAIPMPHNHLCLDPVLCSYLSASLDATERQELTNGWQAAMLSFVGFLYQQQSENPELAARLTLWELPNLLDLLEKIAAVGETGAMVELCAYLYKLLQNLGKPKLLQRIAHHSDAASKVLGGSWSHARFQAGHNRIEHALKNGPLREALEAARKLYQQARIHGVEAYEGADYDNAMASYLLGQVLSTAGQAGPALQLFQQSQQQFKQIIQQRTSRGAEQMTSLTLTRQGNCLNDLGRYDEAAAVYQEATHSYEQQGDYDQAAVNKFELGTVRMNQRCFDEALAAYREALDSFTTLGEQDTLAIVWHQIGMVHEQTGQYEPAENAYRESLALKVRLGDKAGQASTLGQFGNLYGIMGRSEDAVALFRLTAGLYREMQDEANEGCTRSNLADALHQLGRYAEARIECRAAIEHIEAYGHAPHPWESWSLLSAIETADGEAHAAAAARSKAVECYLAYRRDGGENTSDTGQLCAYVGSALMSGNLGEAMNALNEVHKQANLPDQALPLLDALEAIAKGSRDPKLADTPRLVYDDAAEILLLLERMPPPPAAKGLLSGLGSLFGRKPK